MSESELNKVRLEGLVFSIFYIEPYNILIIQSPEGTLLSLKIEEDYE